MCVFWPNTLLNNIPIISSNILNLMKLNRHRASECGLWTRRFWEDLLTPNPSKNVRKVRVCDETLEIMINYILLYVRFDFFCVRNESNSCRYQTRP